MLLEYFGENKMTEYFNDKTCSTTELYIISVIVGMYSNTDSKSFRMVRCHDTYLSAENWGFFLCGGLFFVVFVVVVLFNYLTCIFFNV